MIALPTGKSSGMNNPSLSCGKGSVGSDPYRRNPHVAAPSSDADVSFEYIVTCKPGTSG